MVEIVSKLQKYKVSQEPGAASLCDMLELQAKTLVLLNSDGQLDTRARNLERTVLNLWHMMKSTELKFIALENVSEDMQRAFMQQIGHAERTLQSLISQIPGYSR
ncbi:hypothetical protein OXX59_008265 [Metschnikowia pulcherrima]